MSANPAHGTDGVLYALIRPDAIPYKEPKVRASTDQTAPGEVLGLRLELGKVSLRPASTKKENDGWAVIRRLPIRRVIEVQRQLPPADAFVDVLRLA
jgi:hypothetical protein